MTSAWTRTERYSRSSGTECQRWRDFCHQDQAHVRTVRSGPGDGVMVAPGRSGRPERPRYARQSMAAWRMWHTLRNTPQLRPSHQIDQDQSTPVPDGPRNPHEANICPLDRRFAGTAPPPFGRRPFKPLVPRRGLSLLGPASRAKKMVGGRAREFVCCLVWAIW